MARQSSFFILILSVLNSYFVQCTEFVPVHMWGTEKLSEHVPALHKVSQDSFKDILLEHLKKDPYIIVFAERTLSPEDFAQRDPNGESPFVNLQQLKNQGNYVSYRPNVQNPIGALKQLNKPVTQTSIGSILSSVNVPKDNIWIVNLNDAKDDETRHHMLQRHDSDITSIYENIVKKHKNVLALYTANHSAWIAPDDVAHNKLRNLLQTTDPKADEPTPVVYNDTTILLYLTEKGTLSIKDKTPVSIDSTATFKATGNTTDLTADLQKDNVAIEFIFTQKSNYWYLNKLTVKQGTDEQSLPIKEIYAPVGFSYHCGALNLTNQGKNITLTLPGFQVQTFSNNTDKFGDAYDCVGFTSVPIWSGLFVTAIMLLIVTFGLVMMMDIKTMDRFDDPKGKTITVTASE